MAFKGLVGGASGDMANANDFFGYYNDTVYVAYEGVARLYTISSYRGNDLIDLRDANLANTHLVYSGSGNDTVFGSGALSESFFDQSGNDTALMGAGADTIVAGYGNDVYAGGSGTDTLTFATIYDDFGMSAISAIGVRFDMAITGVQNLGVRGRDRISGFERVFGSYGNDTLLGSAGGDVLFGINGNDLLYGRGGADSLEDGSGIDTLIGGTGADVLTGGQDRDFYRYLTMKDSGRGTSFGLVDQIYGNWGSAADSDRIDLRAIDATPSTGRNDAFIFRGTGAFTSRAGEVRLEVIGSDTLVHVDIDGDAASEMNFWVMGATTLTAIDFLL